MARHPGVDNALRWLDASHLPDDLAAVVGPIKAAADMVLEEIPTDSAELTAGLNLLVQAKDHLVRAKIIDKEKRSE